MLAHATQRGRLSLLPITQLSARLRSATTTIVAIAVVGVAIVLAAWINGWAIEAARQVSLSIEIRERAERFLGHVRDAETGQRGYLLTGDAAYLAPFTSGRAAAIPELDALDALVGPDHQQKERVELARTQAARKLAELDTTIALMRDGRANQALGLMRAGSGVTTMDELRNTVQQLQLAENIRLVALNNREARRRLWASAGIIVALAGLAFAAWLQLRSRQRRSAVLAMTNAELEQIVSERTQQLEGERVRIEALLRDVNHRVGNNLAMVSALLNVQSRQTREPAVKDALAQAQSRIQAIAAGQRRLRLDIETDEIDARAYMEDLLAEIGKAAEGRPITIELDMDSIRLPGRDAVSFVVIVNELVTNAIKHAFPGNIQGRIIVRLRQNDDEEAPALVLAVEDDGVGTPPDLETKGLGQTVIASLLRSMRASMETASPSPGSERPGTRVTLTFPKRQSNGL
jgi:two-component sensor histidine kinase